MPSLLYVLVLQVPFTGHILFQTENVHSKYTVSKKKRGHGFFSA